MGCSVAIEVELFERVMLNELVTDIFNDDVKREREPLNVIVMLTDVSLLLREGLCVLLEVLDVLTDKLPWKLGDNDTRVETVELKENEMEKEEDTIEERVSLTLSVSHSTSRRHAT